MRQGIILSHQVSNAIELTTEKQPRNPNLFKVFYFDFKGHLCKEFFKVAVGPFKSGENHGHRARAV